MSGASVLFRLDGWSSIESMLEQLKGIPEESVQLLDKIGAIIESQTRQRIKKAGKTGKKAAPSGADWPEWSPRYGKTRHQNQSLLMSEGHLLDSMTYVSSPTEVEIGSNLVYAATHQYGDEDRNIPQREYLGLSVENAKEVQVTVDKWLKKRFKE